MDSDLGNSTGEPPRPTLGVGDWIVISVHLTASLLVGMFVTKCKKKSPKSNGADDYFLAGRQSAGCAVAISLVSGLMSGISFLGGPGFTYGDGAPIMIGYLVATVIPAPIAAHLIIPFYHELKLVTVYEYFELRYCRAIRTVAAIIFAVKTTIYLGMVLYAPSLVISTLTPLPIWASIVMCGGSSTLWTIKGGMLAVIWTDFMQSIAMFSVAILALGFAIHSTGGVTEVYNTLGANHRLVDSYFFEWHPLTPTGARGVHPKEDFWSVAIGVAFASVAQCFTDQLAVQRWLTVRSVRQCQVGIYQTTALNLLMTALVQLIGMVIFAYYHSDGRSDPVKKILDNNADRVFPYFVLEVLPQGIPGLLIAGVLGSTMSVFSGGLNASATSIYVDLISVRVNKTISNSRIVTITRRITLVLAATSISLAFLAAQIAGLVKQSVSLLGLSLGPLLGLTLCGMLSTRVNWQGSIIGLGFGMLFAIFIGVSSAICTQNTEHCISALQIGRVSFFWYGGLTTMSTGIVCYIASLPFPAPDIQSLQGLCIWSKKRSKSCVHVSSDEESPLLGIQ